METEKSIFTRIIEREIPGNFVYEDDVVAAFLSIGPFQKGHTLIVPKKPFRNIFNADPEVMAHMMRVAQKIAQSMKETLAVDGVNILLNNEAAAQQSVFHAHLHVIPRFDNDPGLLSPHEETYDEGEAAAVAAKIKTTLLQ